MDVTLRISFNLTVGFYEDGSGTWSPEERERFMGACVYPVVPARLWSFSADTLFDRVFYETTTDERNRDAIVKLAAKWDQSRRIEGISITTRS